MSSIHVLRCLALTLLLVVTGSSSALTIGRHQGVAVLGRPLEIQVPVGLDAGMDPLDLCPEVEVSYGDLRLGSRLFDVQVSGAGEAVRIRVRVAQPLDEPFAAIQVRVGCDQKLSRRFVLLAEAPGGEAAATSPPVPTVSAEAVQAGPAPGASANATPLTPLPVESTTPPKMGSRSAVRPETSLPARAAPGGRPRLQVDPLAIAAMAAPSAARPAPVALPQPPASAGLAAPGASSVAEGARVVALEDEVRKLQDALGRSQAVAAELRARVAESERERLANPVVYGLVLACLFSVGFAAFLWRRVSSRRAAAWWQVPSEPAGDLGLSSVGGGHGAASSARAGAWRPTVDSDRPRGGPEPLRSSSPPATGRASVIAGEPGPMAPAPDSPDPRQAAVPAVSTQELSDIQQEAEFFVSLGEHDRAIEVLRAHIEAHPRASAMAWLELLGLHHQLGQRQDYEALQRDFERLFKVQLPAFDAFNTDLGGLEDHPELLATLQALWPDPSVVEVIKDLIDRGPGEGQWGDALGLQAYRDVLFLYQVMQQLGPTGTGDHAAGSQTPAGLGSGGRVPSDGTDLSLTPVEMPPPTLSVSRSGSASGRRFPDIDLDEVLAQPSAAPDPRRGRMPGEPAPEGLDQLINFDLDTGPDSDRPAARSGGRGGL